MNARPRERVVVVCGYLGEVLYGDTLGEMCGFILTHCYLFSSTSWGVCVGCVCRGGGEKFNIQCI